MPTRKITRGYRRPVGGASQRTQGETESASLVDLLNAIQLHDVSLLPIYPQTGLGIIGKGLSGVIEQSTADVSLTLAFKEGVPSRQHRDTEEEQDWYSLVTEITALQHPPVKHNPHIIDLLGINFSVDSLDGNRKRAWPFTITSKTNRGDLAGFLTERRGTGLTSDIRLQLFAQVAEVIRVLHSCGVSHGDIKPQNILVEQSKSGDHNCKLIDFGSCAINGQKRLPVKSPPWDPPELEEARALKTENLMLSDIYSFGLVCLHILIPLEDLADAKLLLIRPLAQTDEEWNEIQNNLQKMKREDTLASYVLSVLEGAHVPATQRSLLDRITKATLQTQPSHRRLLWENLVPQIEEHLSASFEENAAAALNPPPLVYSSFAVGHSDHHVFDLIASLGELDDTDYVLRANITEDLIHKATYITCLTCQRDYALQVALCYRIGFGILRDKQASRTWLAKSQRDEADITAVVARLRASYRPKGRITEQVRNALGIQVINTADRTGKYQADGRLLKAESALASEVLARECEFGPLHLCLSKLKADLAAIYKARERLSNAEALQQDVVNIQAKCFGTQHPSTLVAKVAIVGILYRQGRLREAENLQQSIQPTLVKVLGPGHPDTVLGLLSLGMIMYGQSKFNKAAEIFVDAIEILSSTLAAIHPMTISAELKLASTLQAQGLHNQASKLISHVGNKIHSVMGDNLIVKSQLLAIEAVLYKNQGMLEHATEKASAALDGLEKGNLDEDNLLRLETMSLLSIIHGENGQLEKERVMLTALLQIKSSRDKDSPSFLTTKAALATNLLKQTRLDEAYVIASEVLDARHESVAVDPSNVVTCTGVLASILLHRGDREGAERKRLSLVASCKSELGEQHPLTLQSIVSLGDFYADQNRFHTAEQLYLTVLQTFREANDLTKTAIDIARRLAETYWEQGGFNKAENLCEEVIVWCKEAFGEGHIEYLSTYHLLFITYVRAGRLQDAENLYSAQLHEQTKGSDLGIFVKGTVVELRKLQGQLEVAERLDLEVLELHESRFGKRHWDTIIAAGNVLSTALYRNFTDEIEKKVIDNIHLQQEILGRQHSSTIQAISKLAYAYSDNGRLDEAEELFQNIDDSGTTEILQNSAAYARLCVKRSFLHVQKGEFDEAQKLEEEALAIRRRILGDTHPATVLVMSNLASTLNDQKKYHEAEGYLRHVVTVREATPDANNLPTFETLKSKAELGYVLLFQEKLAESYKLYQEIVESSQMINADQAMVKEWKGVLQTLLANMRS